MLVLILLPFLVFSQVPERTYPCITPDVLVAYNYTDYPENIDYENKIFPENFCYGIVFG